MHAIELYLIQPNFLVDLLHSALFLRHHLKLTLHLLQPLRIIDILRPLLAHP